MLRFDDVSKSYGSRPVLQRRTGHFAPGAYALRGPNGIGKSTLLRVVAGVDEADGGDIVIDGHSLRAQPAAAKARLAYSVAPSDYAYRPSINVFFECIARHWKRSAAGILLTGMGRDGAEGLLAMRLAGKLTIAQDRDSSAVYGMPRAAAELGAADLVLPLDRIAAALQKRGNGNVIPLPDDGFRTSARPD